MECPACQNQLKKEMHENTELDVCNKCGGVFFDNFELEKFDNIDEPTGSLLEISFDASLQVDHDKARNCPKCLNIVMQRHYFGPKREIVIDECAGCGGVWLDQGELREIRTNYPTVEEKQRAVEALFQQTSAAGLAKLKEQNREERETYHKISKVLNYLLPTWAILRKK